MLKINNLTFSYGKKEVLCGVSLEVKPREIFVIVGESGSGKSTLLQCISGLNSPETCMYGGEIWFQEKDLMKMSPKEKHLLRGKEIAMVFQQPALSFDPVMTIEKQAYEAYRAHNRRAGKKEIRERMEMLLSDMGLAHPVQTLKSYPFELSGGMSQRAALAIAMLNNPSLLLADEPTSALDATVQAQVAELMLGLREKYGMTILMVTHNIGVASYMADQIAIMRQGNIVEQGDKFRLLTEPEQEYSKKLIQAVPSLKNF